MMGAGAVPLLAGLIARHCTGCTAADVAAVPEGDPDHPVERGATALSALEVANALVVALPPRDEPDHAGALLLPLVAPVLDILQLSAARLRAHGEDAVGDAPPDGAPQWPRLPIMFYAGAAVATHSRFVCTACAPEGRGHACLHSLGLLGVCLHVASRCNYVLVSDAIPSLRSLCASSGPCKACKACTEVGMRSASLLLPYACARKAHVCCAHFSRLCVCPSHTFLSHTYTSPANIPPTFCTCPLYTHLIHTHIPCTRLAHLSHMPLAHIPHTQTFSPAHVPLTF